MSTIRQATYDHRKYQPFPVAALSQRQWPDRQIEQAPMWCSEDLRDGNQALITPLSVNQKKDFFKLLVDIGFKEIVVGFPSASQTDFDFVRTLIDQALIPDDVTISVLTPAREALIERSFEALTGAKRAIVHLYNSTSIVQRERVFKLGKDAVVKLAVSGAAIIRRCAARQPQTEWRFEYSPESFTATEPAYALEICNAVSAVWQPTVEQPVIINLPATVENSTPNVYADRIEWFSANINHRDAVILSVHTHNDRGCAVAAAELALLAGAQRVEGTLLGNGERTGNADLLVMAMNLYSQGIAPGLDFSAMPEIVQTVSGFNHISVHPRHPYAGDLVFTAFSGSHQDAIKKCLAAHRPEETWNVPYLPVDPADIGRSYQQVVRINSQSGKGGVAYIVEQELGLQLPRWLQIDLSCQIKQLTETEVREISPAELVAFFNANYWERQANYQLLHFRIDRNRLDVLQARLAGPDGEFTLTGSGKGALAAFIDALQSHFNSHIEIANYDEHALSPGTEANAVCFIRVRQNGVLRTGIACHSDIVSASLNAVLQAISGCPVI